MTTTAYAALLRGINVGGGKSAHLPAERRSGPEERLTATLVLVRGRRAVQVVLASCLLAGCAHPSSAPIALPSAGADARTVLSVYLKALRAGDCRTARQLATSSFSFGNGELCGHLTVLSYTEPGQPALPGNGEAIFSTVLTVVGADASMNNGKNTWFYDLKQQPDGRWRLVGGGSGP